VPRRLNRLHIPGGEALHRGGSRLDPLLNRAAGFPLLLGRFITLCGGEQLLIIRFPGR